VVQVHNWPTDNTLNTLLRRWARLTASVNVILQLSTNPRKRLSLLTIIAQAVTHVGEKMQKALVAKSNT
jgi:hypothetical protein